jgi:hypothetical protein
MEAANFMIINEPNPYKEAYPIGTKVRIANRALLEEFKRIWQYHHKLTEEQIEYADRETTVKSVGFYHGGDPVYGLADVPGDWLEQCLQPGS